MTDVVSDPFEALAQRRRADCDPNKSEDGS